MVHLTDLDLHALLDGELLEIHAGPIRAHLNDCPACARKRSELERERWETAALLASLDHSPAPDADLVPEERRQMVRTALQALPLRDRRLVLLRHAGRSYREIASGLDIPEFNVGTLLAQARVSFRAAFERRHGAPD
jgi:RNA polymerase sigma-70 factor, ECF subfamily